MKKLLLIGAGHAHAEVLRQFGEHPAANAAITLVSLQRQFPYAGMFPGLVAGHYTHAQCHIDLVPVAARAGIEFVVGRINAIDADKRIASTAGGRDFEFDFASIDVGSMPLVPDIPGLRQFALLARPAGLFLEGWERVIDIARDGGISKFTVVGGDVAAVELMLAMVHRLARELPPERFDACGFSIVTGGARLIDSQPEGLGRAVEEQCAARGVSILRGAAVVAVERDAVRLSNGARLASDITVWAAGARPGPWLKASGLPCDENGFLKVDESLRSTGSRRIYAAGSCTVPATRAGLERTEPAHADAIDARRALQQGPVLAANLRQALAGEPPQHWLPTPGQLAMISLGQRKALALRAGNLITGPRWAFWRWKDWTDRRWMRRYRVAT